jgi:thiol-disulfide isomerase/thioredoxin
MPLSTALLVLLAAAAPAAQEPPKPAPVPAPSPAPKPAPAQAATPEEAAWTAAHDLKRKADYERAAAAFEAYARAYPGTPRAFEAQVEDGVCWFSLGRARQQLQRNTPASREAFAKARALFEGVVQAAPKSDVAGRAQYMRGTVAAFAGELKLADEQYSRGIELYASDAKYLPKCVERRAAVRRAMLRTADATADLQRYLRDFPKGEDAESARRYLQYLAMCEKPAPELAPEAWVQGGPHTLANLQGDVVLLYFFATWCENCEKARPFLIDLNERYEPMGVHVIGVVDHSKGQTVESVRAFLPANGIRFPVLMDSGRTTAAYLGQKIPDVVLIDRLGRVRWHDNPGVLQEATLEAILTEDPATVGAPRPPGK